MTDTLPPDNEGNRFLGTGLMRSGDQALLLRGIGRGLAWFVIGLARGVRYLYDGARSRRMRP